MTTATRQLVAVTVLFETDAHEDWADIKYPGCGGYHPEDGEPPVTFREDLSEAVESALRFTELPEHANLIAVTKFEADPVREPSPVYGSDEEPF